MRAKHAETSLARNSWSTRRGPSRALTVCGGSGDEADADARDEEAGAIGRGASVRSESLIQSQILALVSTRMRDAEKEKSHRDTSTIRTAEKALAVT